MEISLTTLFNYAGKPVRYQKCPYNHPVLKKFYLFATAPSLHFGEFMELMKLRQEHEDAFITIFKKYNKKMLYDLYIGETMNQIHINKLLHEVSNESPYFNYI